MANWRQSVGVKRNSHKVRPSWVLKKGQSSRRTGCHIFCRRRREERAAAGDAVRGEGSGKAFLQDCRAAWLALSPEERATYTQTAREENVVENVLAAVNCGPEETLGPWGMAAASGRWPLTPEFLKNSLEQNGGFQQEKQLWEEARCFQTPGLACVMPQIEMTRSPLSPITQVIGLRNL